MPFSEGRVDKPQTTRPEQDHKRLPVAPQSLSKTLKPIVEKEAQPEVKSLSYNLDKLSRAVAFAETGGCKDGTAKKRNNCHGIMTWKSGKRSPAYFSNFEASHAAFKKIWMKSYKVYPTLKQARKWTGNDHPERWLHAVNQYYNSH